MLGAFQATWGRAPKPLAVTACVVFLAHGCRHACDNPCLNWVELGDTYEVELVQYLENPGGTGVPARSSHDPCGDLLDLAVGDTFSVLAEKRDAPWCRDDCFNVNLRASIPGVSITELGPQAHGLGFLFMESEVRIGATCTGSYEVNLTPIPPYFLENSGEYFSTDYVLFREFVADDVSGCADLEERLTPPQRTCWDAWAVTIKDSSGEFITEEFPPPEDAGM